MKGLKDKILDRARGIGIHDQDQFLNFNGSNSLLIKANLKECNMSMCSLPSFLRRRFTHADNAVSNLRKRGTNTLLLTCRPQKQSTRPRHTKQQSKAKIHRRIKPLSHYMAEEQLKKTESPAAPAPALVPAPAPAPVVAVAKNDVVEQKPLVQFHEEKKPEESKALVVVDKTSDSAEKKISGGSHDRDVALGEVEKEKRLSFIKAWEDSEKSKAENKSQKKLSDVTAWENSKKASLEAKLKKKEEQLERKKAEYAEKMKNKVALVHREAEEKRAMVEAQRGEELLKAEEMAAKFRATNTTPKKLLGCF
ncbi:hypothetical protein Q3G72_003524 [Acer saccharum]|nr:hypothetical protein Q3G72_003524 [Acer saccharum]